MQLKCSNECSGAGDQVRDIVDLFSSTIMDMLMALGFFWTLFVVWVHMRPILLADMHVIYLVADLTRGVAEQATTRV